MGGAHGAPYGAALVLLTWAADNWHEIDGQYPQTDLLRLPLHRLLNVLHVHMIRLAKDDKALDQLSKALEWPDRADRVEEQMTETSARESLAALGFNADAMVAQALAARRQHFAQLEAAEAMSRARDTDDDPVEAD